MRAQGTARIKTFDEEMCERRANLGLALVKPPSTVRPSAQQFPDMRGNMMCLAPFNPATGGRGRSAFRETGKAAMISRLRPSFDSMPESVELSGFGDGSLFDVSVPMQMEIAPGQGPVANPSLVPVPITAQASQNVATAIPAQETNWWGSLTNLVTRVGSTILDTKKAKAEAQAAEAQASLAQTLANLRNSQAGKTTMSILPYALIAGAGVVAFLYFRRPSKNPRRRMRRARR